MNLTGANVLIVEDTVEIQKLYEHQLSTAGAEITIAENGAVAIEKIAEANSDFFDVIIMDMQMPVMDGCEATRTLRSQGYTRPIIALTAHSETEDREKALSAGCNQYYTKPLPGKVLIEVVRTWWKMDAKVG